MLATCAVVPRWYGEPQRRAAHEASSVAGASPSGRLAAQATSWRPSSTRSSMPASRASCSMISPCSSSSSSLVADTVTRPDVGHLGVAGDELVLPVEQRLGGPAVAGVDPAALLLLGGGVGLELDQVALDAPP